MSCSKAGYYKPCTIIQLGTLTGMTVISTARWKSFRLMILMMILIIILPAEYLETADDTRLFNSNFSNQSWVFSRWQYFDERSNGEILDDDIFEELLQEAFFAQEDTYLKNSNSCVSTLVYCFRKYVVCIKCNSLYDYEDCIEFLAGRQFSTKMQICAVAKSYFKVFM